MEHWVSHTSPPPDDDACAQGTIQGIGVICDPYILPHYSVVGHILSWSLTLITCIERWVSVKPGLYENNVGLQLSAFKLVPLNQSTALNYREVGITSSIDIEIDAAKKHSFHLRLLLVSPARESCSLASFGVDHALLEILLRFGLHPRLV